MRRLPLLVVSAVLATGLPRPGRAEVLTGIDVLQADGFRALKGKRVGLITNPTGRTREGKSTAQLLAETAGINLVMIFAPEHGITGASEDNSISNSEILLGGRQIPVRSLQGLGMAKKRPLPEDLKKLDVLVFDIQDIGARFYTYAATMGMAMEATAKLPIEMMVLDRPNPITGSIVEGPILDDLSFRLEVPTAYYPLSVRHGMTVGEIATMYGSEIHHPLLTVVKLKGWSRDQWYDQTGLSFIPPSPNMPDLDAATMYPGIGLFEAMPDDTLAVGRGTPSPFRWVGAPWMKPALIVAELKSANLDGVQFSAQDYTPTKSMFKDVLCHGVRMTITDRNRLRPTQVFLALVVALRKIHPREMKWSWVEVKKMVGSDGFRRIYESGADPVKLKNLFEAGAREFTKIRAPFLLY